MSMQPYRWTRMRPSLRSDYTSEVVGFWQYDYRYHPAHEHPLLAQARYQIIQYCDEVRMYYVRDVRSGIAGYGKDSCINPPFAKLADAKRVVEMLLRTEGEPA